MNTTETFESMTEKRELTAKAAEAYYAALEAGDPNAQALREAFTAARSISERAITAYYSSN